MDSTFTQAVQEVLHSIQEFIKEHPHYCENSLIERLIVPDRIVEFKVVWEDDAHNVCINRGWRVQFNNALGPYKGGLRFHPTVNVDILKFLGFEQIFKNALTGLSLGGGKGGSDFDPKGKSDREIMRFCQAFMRSLHDYVGPRIDVPAGDIGVGSTEIGYLFGEYKRLSHRFEGVLTGKPYPLGGSLVRPEATGYGIVYFAQAMLKDLSMRSLEGEICLVSGSGNVALHTIEKLLQIGAKPVACSDSRGVLYDPQGLDSELLKKIKLIDKGSLKDYCERYSHAMYTPLNKEEHSHPLWSIPCFAAFPCATQNELNEEDAKTLIANGCQAVIEGANMPSTPEAISLIQTQGLLFAPAKAANAGGVAVSQFEMAQNAGMVRASFEQIDEKLETTMDTIYHTIAKRAKELGNAKDLVKAANITAFCRVADAMIAEGY